MKIYYIFFAAFFAILAFLAGVAILLSYAFMALPVLPQIGLLLVMAGMIIGLLIRVS